MQKQAEDIKEKSKELEEAKRREAVAEARQKERTSKLAQSARQSKLESKIKIDQGKDATDAKATLNLDKQRPSTASNSQTRKSQIPQKLRPQTAKVEQQQKVLP